MRLGLSLGYWGSGPPSDSLALAVEADRLGYAVVWAAEAYGSDAATVCGWVGALTERVDIGSAVLQIPARTPAMTAMTAATLDALSGGRFRLGLGVSGPQVSEGWHGVRFDAPLRRTREYVDIVRLALGRQSVEYAGEHFTLPLPDGPGKALRLGFRPLRVAIPIYLAAVGPRSLELAGEIADGWLAVFYSPEHSGEMLGSISTGAHRVGRVAARSGNGADGVERSALPDGFDVVPTVPVVLEDDVGAAADRLRPYSALYVGGMGSREQNFYNALAVRMGFEVEARRVQDLYLDGRARDAAAAVPQEFIDRTALIGSRARIRDRLARYAESGVTTLSVAPEGPTLDARLRVLRCLADLVGDNGTAT